MKIGIQNYGENGAHLFTNDSPELEYVGLSSYSMYQLSGIIASNSLLNLTGTKDQIFDALIGKSAPNDPKYLKFNKDTGGFYEVTIPKSNIKNLIEWHEYFNENPRYTSVPTGGFSREEASGHLIDISNSLSGCLTFLVSGNLGVDYTAPENNAGCIKGINTNVNVHFNKRNDDPNNEIVEKFHAMAGIPSTPAGTKYSWTGTQKAVSKNHPGVLSPVQDGGEQNTNNMVSAPIAKSYCANSATWEFGTQQILVRLLTNVDAVEETELDAETFDNLSFDELANPGSVFYLSNYTTGWASPIYPQNKNPGLAMPAFVTKSCDNKNTKEKIIVVNRSTRPYAIGELAKAARICGEWILSPLSDKKTQVFTPVINKWRFQKFIVDSDSYFKNYKYFESLNYDGSLSDDEKKYSANVSPSYYEFSMTRLYFIDMSTSSYFPELNGLNDKVKIAKANMNAAVQLETLRSWTDTQWNAYVIPQKAAQIEQGSIIVPSDRYWQSTVADQMGIHTGGNNPYNIIGRTNIAINNNPSEDDTLNWAYKFNHFWGPIFNGGYDGNKIGQIKDGQVAFKTYRVNSQYFSNSITNGDDSNVEINDFGPARNIQYDPARYMFSQVNDGGWSQFPAEMALLGGPNAKNGGPQECFNVIKNRIGPSIAEEGSDAYYLIREVMGYDNSGIPRRWDWLYIDNGSNDDYLVSDLYDLKPQGSTTLTFMPLSAEMVGSSDKFSDDLGPVKQGNTGDLNPSITLLRKLYRTARGFNTGAGLWGHDEDGDGYKSRFPFLAEDYWITAIGQSTLPHVWGNKFFTREKQEGFDSFRTMKSYNSGLVNRSYDVIPYDYAVKQTSSHANGNPVIWYAFNSSEDDSTQRVRPSGKTDTGQANADCVGVICAKVSLSWNQDSIPITVSERFGLNTLGFTLNLGANPNGSFFVTPLGGFGNTGPIAGEQKRVETPNWGSTVDSSEGLYSFSTNALFARVFTQWPEKQTLFDGRYFGVLHFNPMSPSGTDIVETELKSSGKLFTGTWSPAVNITNSYRTSTLPEYERYVDKITSAVDFRVPTYADPKGINDNTIVPEGSLIDRCGNANIVLRPQSEWRVNPVRRGKMFAISGSKRVFRYFKRVIGVSKDTNLWKFSYAIDSNGNRVTGTGADDGRGKNYSVGDIIGINDGGGIGAKIEILTVGSGGSVSTFKVIDQGQGYLPSNFKDQNWGSAESRKSDPLIVTAGNNIKVKNGKASGLKVGPLVGEVYDRLEEDVGPSEVSSITRLSSPSAGGEEGIIQGTSKKSILLSKDRPSTKYDLFFHFHNDIAHTLSAWREWQLTNTSGLAQYCTITIG